MDDDDPSVQAENKLVFLPPREIEHLMRCLNELHTKVNNVHDVCEVAHEASNT